MKLFRSVAGVCGNALLNLVLFGYRSNWCFYLSAVIILWITRFYMT